MLHHRILTSAPCFFDKLLDCRVLESEKKTPNMQLPENFEYARFQRAKIAFNFNIHLLRDSDIVRLEKSQGFLDATSIKSRRNIHYILYMYISPAILEYSHVI